MGGRASFSRSDVWSSAVSRGDYGPAGDVDIFVHPQLDDMTIIRLSRLHAVTSKICTANSGSTDCPEGTLVASCARIVSNFGSIPAMHELTMIGPGA